MYIQCLWMTSDLWFIIDIYKINTICYKNAIKKTLYTFITKQTMQPIVASQNTHMSGRTETSLSPTHSFEVISSVCQERDSLWALGWRGNYTYLLSSFVSVQPSLLQEQRRGVFVLGEGPGAAAPQHSTCQLLPRSLQEPVSTLESIREIA